MQEPAATDTPLDYDALAETYERAAEPLTGPFAHEALALAALPSGTVIADIAAGTGALALPAARAGLIVHATDLAAGMVARLAAKLAPYPGSTAAVGDCTALGAADGSVAAAFSMFGVSIIPPWRAGLAEMVRVTRSSGLIIVGAWLEDRGSKPFLVARNTFVRLFPDREFLPSNAFQMWTTAGLRDAMLDAGCADATVHPRTIEVIKASAEAALADVTPFNVMVPGVGALSAAERARFDAGQVEAYHAYAAADGTIRLPMEALIGVGRVPA